jgi:hypothetical protein
VGRNRRPEVKYIFEDGKFIKKPKEATEQTDQPINAVEDEQRKEDLK